MIEAALSLLGIIGLVGANLTVSRDHPLKGPRARVAGLILATALPLSFATSTIVLVLASRRIVPYAMEAPILRLLDPVPAITVVLVTSAYLYFTNPDKKRATIVFWLTAAVPAVGLFLARNLTSLYQVLFQFSVGLPVPLVSRLELPNIVIGVLIPVILAFATNLFYPVATERTKALSYAVPVASLHAYYYAISDWIRPAISSIAYPGDAPGAGYQELINGTVTFGMSALLMGLVGFASFTATRIRGVGNRAA